MTKQDIEILSDQIRGDDQYPNEPQGNVNRRYKDRFFAFLFGSNKKYALDLFNGVNGSDLSDPEEIVFNTIGDFIFMGRRNDVSFLIDDQMNIYEHQSTFSENMPIRMGIYLFRLYEAYIEKSKQSLFTSDRIILPEPRLIVFYNGRKDFSDEIILSLSDSFAKKEEHSVEVKVRMVNINYGHNSRLLSSCQILSEYSWFVAQVRAEKEKGADLRTSIDSAIMKMPKKFEIRNIILKNKAEVIGMLFTEWDEEKEREKMEYSWSKYYRETIYKEANEKGIEEGRIKGLEEGRERGLEEGRVKGLEEGREKGLEEGRERGLKEGKAEGWTEGINESRDRIIAYYMKSGMSRDEASKICEEIMGSDQ
ncbi:MAG: hypothetical protein IKS54_09935 [Erysipelotrichaceae bacterium]|nr:hypothetical protein [Erysipelotrichaceae bacterium]